MENVGKETKQRTIAQNRALHLWFTQLAEALNEAGLDMRATLKPEISINWTGEGIKEYLWRPVQKLQVKKQSTTELTTDEIDKIWETLNRFLGEKFGVHVPFPSIEELGEKLSTENNLN
jgi:hypothetical protein